MFSFPHVSNQTTWASLFAQSTLCPAHMTQFDMITLSLFGEEYKSWRSSFCNTNLLKKHPPLKHP